jgi:hypothetical protein
MDKQLQPAFIIHDIRRREGIETKGELTGTLRCNGCSFVCNLTTRLATAAKMSRVGDKSKGEMILHTANSGESLEVQLRGIEDFFIDIQALSDGNVWAVGYNKGLVLHSRDEGKSWSRLRFEKEKVREEKIRP